MLVERRDLRGHDNRECQVIDGCLVEGPGNEEGGVEGGGERPIVFDDLYYDRVLVNLDCVDPVLLGKLKLATSQAQPPVAGS